jgi:NLI interacting factor-like phosphatase
MPRKLCLILDLNGTLVYRTAKRLSKDASLINNSSSRNGEGLDGPLQGGIAVNGKYVYFRPHLRIFFQFLAKHQDQVELGIWTSMTPKNAYEIVFHLWQTVCPPSSSAAKTPWPMPFMTDEGLIHETKDAELLSLYNKFIQKIQHQTPVPIRFLFTQHNCLCRDKIAADDPAFNPYKPIMFKHLPVFWEEVPLSVPKILQVYGNAVVRPHGQFVILPPASSGAPPLTTEKQFKLPKLLKSPITFPQSDVLLLEDSSYKFLAAPANGLVISEFDPRSSASAAKDQQPQDDILQRLIAKIQEYLASPQDITSLDKLL